MRNKFILFIALLAPLALSAQEAAEKLTPRKERNSLEISAGVEGSLTNLNDAWIATSGGDNSVTVSSSLFLKHKYVKNKFTLESAFSAKFGYYNVSVEKEDANGNISDQAVWYKNQDEFSMSIAPSWEMTKNWSYGATASFRSQFAHGYLSSGSQEDMHLKSAFLAPGYLNVAVGVNYQCPNEKFPIKISLSPIAMSGIFVANKEVRENALYGYSEHEDDNYAYVDVYGVNADKSSKFEGGSSVQVDFDRTWGKNSTFRYMTTLYSFYGWISNAAADNGYSNYNRYQEALTEWSEDENADGSTQPTFLVKPTVRWVNRLEIKATKYLYTNVDFELYYDRAQNAKVQTKTILSLGLAYKFTNK
ncbi:MAG: DUF3078 domain-containing protein [Rikenellaceae bacterium]